MNKENSEIVNPFINAVVHTLQVQCKLKVTAHTPRYMTKSEDGLIRMNVAAIVGVKAQDLMGSVALAFPKNTFLLVMSAMLGDTITDIDTDTQDGVGELLNIVFGTVKKEFNDKGYKLDKAIPSVIAGDNVAIKHLTDAKIILVPMSIENTPGFNLEISLK
jgi:chemotaxis protein CheX